MSGTPFIHLCSHPGCSNWGAFGRRQRPVGGGAAYVWRCRDHLWEDFYIRLPPRLVAGAGAASPPIAVPKQGNLL